MTLSRRFRREQCRRAFFPVACALVLSVIFPGSSAQAQVASLEITDEDFEPIGAIQLQPGDSLFVGAEAFDASGNALDPAALTFLWTSSNVGVVEVRPNDGFEVYVVATGPGRAQVEIAVNRYTQILQVAVGGETPVVVAAADSVLPEAVLSPALANVVRVTATRFGTTSCQTGYRSDRPGLVVTSYTAIRGAVGIQLTGADGLSSNTAMVAAYDTDRNIAVLQATEFGAFFEPLDSLAAQSNAWQLGFPDCRSGADARRTAVAPVDAGSGTFALADSLAVSRIGGAVIGRDGRLIGLANRSAGGVSASTVAGFLDRAEAAADVLTVRAVAERQRHLLGSVELTTEAAAAQVHIQPTQANQWPELEETVSLPYTFIAPSGRYRADLIVNGQTASTTFFRIDAGLATNQALSPTIAAVGQGRPGDAGQPPGAEIEQSGGGGFPMPLLIVGAIGAGAAAFLLGGGSGGPDTTSTGGGKTTGTITIFIPRP